MHNLSAYSSAISIKESKDEIEELLKPVEGKVGTQIDTSDYSESDMSDYLATDHLEENDILDRDLVLQEEGLSENLEENLIEGREELLQNNQLLQDSQELYEGINNEINTSDEDIIEEINDEFVGSHEHLEMEDLSELAESFDESTELLDYSLDSLEAPVEESEIADDNDSIDDLVDDLADNLEEEDEIDVLQSKYDALQKRVEMMENRLNNNILDNACSVYIYCEGGIARGTVPDLGTIAYPFINCSRLTRVFLPGHTINTEQNIRFSNGLSYKSKSINDEYCLFQTKTGTLKALSIGFEVFFSRNIFLSFGGAWHMGEGFVPKVISIVDYFTYMPYDLGVRLFSFHDRVPVFATIGRTVLNSRQKILSYCGNSQLSFDNLASITSTIIGVMIRCCVYRNLNISVTLGTPVANLILKIPPSGLVDSSLIKIRLSYKLGQSC